MSAFEETAVQTMSIDTTRQLVADRRAALVVTVRRGGLRGVFSRAHRPRTLMLDLAALENAPAPTPAVIIGARAAAAPDAARVDAARVDAARVDKVA